MVTVQNIDELETYLDTVDPNTSSNPYDITIYSLTTASSKTVPSVLNTKKKYINLHLQIGYLDVSVATETLAGTQYIKNVVLTNCWTIGANVFKNCTGLETLSMTTIESVGYCKLQANCFYGCSALRKIYINGKPDFENGSFTGCTALQILSLNCELHTFGGKCFKGIATSSKHLKIFCSDDFAEFFYTDILADSSMRSTLFNDTSYQYVEVYNKITPAEDLPVPSYSTDNGIITVNYDDLSDLIFYDYYNNNICGIGNSTVSSPCKLNLTNYPSTFNHKLTGENALIYPTKMYMYDGLSYDCTVVRGYFDLSETNGSNITSIDMSENTHLLKVPVLSDVYSIKFQNCTNLTEITIESSEITGTSAFDGCTNLVSVDFSSVENIGNASSMFKNCTSLQNLDISNLKKVSTPSGMFYNCSALKLYSLPCSFYAYKKNINKNKTYIGNTFYNCTNLYNGGIIDVDTHNSLLTIGAFSGSNVKSIAILRSSVDEYLLDGILTNNLKIYTTSEYYDDLTASIAQNYSTRNFQVIEVDACLDYDELEDWLQAQPQNTADTPYKIFIGGGLSADKVYGSYDEWGNITPSDLSNIILTYGKYVDLSATQLPSDCTDLTSSISGIWHELQSELIQQEYITAFCEIPNTVTTLNGFAAFATELKSFGINNEIPSSVINAQRAFQNNTKLEKIIVNHQINNNCDYTYWILNDLIKLYAKDCTFFLNERQQYHLNYQIILECEYSDLNTYLGWFRSSWEDVCLKVNGLTTSDIEGSYSSGSPRMSDFSKVLKGINISDTTIRGFIENSTFDLRLTEIPNNTTSLEYCFFNVNISYSFVIPNSVTNMFGTFCMCRKLKEPPLLPSSLINMEACFAYATQLINTPLIPNTVTNMANAFFCTAITEMPDIPNGVTSLSAAFQETNIVQSKEIPSSVTDMTYCFYKCRSLEEVTNISSSVTNLSSCFNQCSSLKTINGWGVDVNNATMSNCFTGCTSLTEINTTTKETTNYDKWVHITVKTDTTDNTKYNLTLRTLATETQPAQTLTLQVDKDVIYSYLTDEILFSPSGTLSDSYITDMLNYKYPFGGGLDPSRKNFVLWAAQGSVVKQNLSSQSGFTGSDINVSNNNNTKIASIIGKYTGDVLPTGTMFIYGGSTAPSGWLLCDGSAISRSTYAELFSVIGTSYGVGDGSTTFNIPDMRDRFVQGASTSNPIGTKLEAGLPNIKGFFGDLDRWREQLNNADALNELGISTNTFFNMTSRLYKDGKSGDSGVINACGFDASRASSIYGNSDTVQPPAVCMNYIIKY